MSVPRAKRPSFFAGMFRRKTPDILAQWDLFPRDYVLVVPEGHLVQDIGLASWDLEHSDGQRLQIYQPPHPHISKEKQSILERLPSELLENVQDFLIPQEILSLGLSSYLLWPAVLHRIHRRYRKLTAPYAGKVVGFHGRSSSFTEKQIQEYGLGSSSRCLDILSDWKVLWQVQQAEEIWLRALSVGQARWKEFNLHDWESIKEDVSKSSMYPSDKVWMLRNLTTSQYVRSDKLRPPRSAVPGPWTYGLIAYYQLIRNKSPMKRNHPYQTVPGNDTPLTLTQILLCSICWSTNPVNDEKHLQFHNGRWAGCKFDIVTQGMHEAEMEMKKVTTRWTDASVQMAVDVGNLRWWLAHLGSRSKLFKDPKYLSMCKLDREKYQLSS